MNAELQIMLYTETHKTEDFELCYFLSTTHFFVSTTGKQVFSDL